MLVCDNHGSATSLEVTEQLLLLPGQQAARTVTLGSQQSEQRLSSAALGRENKKIL